MLKTKATKAFKKIAAREGISVTEVHEEIQRAIDIAMVSSDHIAQEHWRKMSPRGEKPTPEEAVVYLAKQAKRKLK